jgi:drug/metabolite transporter superfamily protein YnfA
MVAVVGVYIHLKDAPISSPRSGLLLTLANVFGKIASVALIVPTTEALGQLKWNWFHESKAMWDFEISDKATRGPWGAVMLLFRTKGRSLAALGALLVVLLLAIDTFLQQVVDFPDRWSLQGAVSTLPVTVRYNSGTEDVFEMVLPLPSAILICFMLSRKSLTATAHNQSPLVTALAQTSRS